MKISLYDLSDHYFKALDFLTDPEQDIDQQTINDTLEALDGELDDKMANVARMINMLEHEAEGIEAVAKRQKERAKAIENKAGWLRDYLKDSMQHTGHTKISRPDIAVSLAKTPVAVKILDESQIPTDFWREKIERSISKTAIKDAGGCPGAVLESGFRLAIK